MDAGFNRLSTMSFALEISKLSILLYTDQIFNHAYLDL